MKQLVLFVSGFVLSGFILIGTTHSVEAKVYTLKTCKELALKNNRKIKEKQIEIKKAVEVKKSAYTKYFPKVEATAFAMRANKGLIEAEVPEMNLPVYDGNPANLATPSQFAYFPGMDLSLLDEANIISVTAIQPIYAGGRIVNGNKLAALGVEVSQEQLCLTEKEIDTVTVATFWTIVSLQAKEKTLASYEALLLSLQKDVQNAYDAGLVQKSDLLKVQLKLNEVRTHQLQLKNGLDILRQNMNIHMGVPHDKTMVLDDHADTAISPEKIFSDKHDALGRRIEYQLLTKAVEAQRLQKKIARGEILPEVFVGAQALAVDALDERMARGILFAGVNVPISDWWGKSHKLKAHNAQIEIAENRLSEASELLQLQMEKSYNDLVDGYQQIELSQLTVAQSEEHLKVIKDNFDAGIMNTSDLLEAESLFQQAQDALVDAQTGYKIKVAQYLQATAQ